MINVIIQLIEPKNTEYDTNLVSLGYIITCRFTPTLCWRGETWTLHKYRECHRKSQQQKRWIQHIWVIFNIFPKSAPIHKNFNCTDKVNYGILLSWVKNHGIDTNLSRFRIIFMSFLCSSFPWWQASKFDFNPSDPEKYLFDGNIGLFRIISNATRSHPPIQVCLTLTVFATW